MPAPTKTVIDDYLAKVSPAQRAALTRLRRDIRAAAPDAEECISYQLAAFRHHGMLVAFGASPQHCSFYLMDDVSVAAHRDELAPYDTSKGTIRFAPDAPLPSALVRKLVLERVAANEARRAPPVRRRPGRKAAGARSRSRPARR